MRGLIVLGVLAGVLPISSPAFAWGDVGHRVICRIAYEELKPEIKARVDALVAIDPKFRTFANGCTWPDVFPRQRPPEHYVDLPRARDHRRWSPFSSKAVTRFHRRRPPIFMKVATSKSSQHGARGG